MKGRKKTITAKEQDRLLPLIIDAPFYERGSAHGYLRRAVDAKFRGRLSLVDRLWLLALAFWHPRIVLKFDFGPLICALEGNCHMWQFLAAPRAPRRGPASPRLGPAAARGARLALKLRKLGQTIARYCIQEATRRYFGNRVDAIVPNSFVDVPKVDLLIHCVEPFLTRAEIRAPDPGLERLGEAIIEWLSASRQTDGSNQPCYSPRFDLTPTQFACAK